MKKILLLINRPEKPYSTFANILKPFLEKTGQFEIEVTHDRNRLVELSAFDAVGLYIAGGSFTPEQEHGLADFVSNGGGLLAVHGSNAMLSQYRTYIEMIGSEFAGHDPVGTFSVSVEGGFDEALPRLSREFRVEDECFKIKPTVDEPLRYFLHGGWRAGRYPLGYIRDYGKGRIFYTALGHGESTFRHPDFQYQLLKGLRYVCKMKDKPEIRVGVVGYGPLYNMGRHHASRAVSTYGMKLTAVCDRDPARLKAAKEEQGDRIETFSDAKEMAASGLIDLGVAVVPHVYHYEVAKTLLEAGLHVITEKPFVVHIHEAEDLIRLAKEKGVMLSTYHNRHWDPDILTARAVVESGAIGEVFSIECNMVGYGAQGQQWRDMKEISGGLLYDMGAHQFEKILQLVPWEDGKGNPINRHAKLYGNFLKKMWHVNTNEDHCRAYVKFETGLEAQLTQSNLCTIRKPLWTILGTRGSATLEEFDTGATVVSVTPEGRTINQTYPALPGQWHLYYNNVADHLLSGLPLLITPEWAKATIQCIAGCEIASREDRLVEVTFDF